METIYYNLDARRVSTCDMASGETSPQCRNYAILRSVEAKRAGVGGKVLDLEAYRRRPSGTEPDAGNLWEEAPSAAAPAGDDPPERRSARRTGLALDLFATLAILVMAVVVVVCFLPFL
jgi:hypothetical protein